MEQGDGEGYADHHESGAADPGLIAAPYSRRTFLALAAGGVGATFLSPADLAHAAANRVEPGVQPAGYFFVWSTQFTRTRDLVDLTFSFVNLQVDTRRSGNYLTKTSINDPAYLIVEFPPQHVAEEAVYFDPSATVRETVPTATAPYTNPNTLLDKQSHRPLPLKSRIAGPSRLAFTVVDDIPYTESGLLNWTGGAYVPAVVDQADSGAWWEFVGSFAGPAGYFRRQELAEPTGRQTAIEFPYGLILTPSSSGFWRHRLDPVTRTDLLTGVTRTEVWSTRLHEYAYTVGDAPAPAIDFVLPEREPRLRAVWTKDPVSVNSYGVDYDPDPSRIPAPVAAGAPDLDPPFVALPSRNDRWQLVGQMTRQLAIGDPEPAPLRAKKFRMSSLGATVDMSGAWDEHTEDGEVLDLIGYVHRAFGGRDIFVKVVIAGYLYPTLHPAAEVRVVERLFVTPTGSGSSTGPVAYLQMWKFLVVRGRTRTFGGDSNFGRGFPFTEVTLNVEATPPVGSVKIGTYDITNAYFPSHKPNEVYRFPATVTDQTGRQHQTEIPLAFVRGSFANADTFDGDAFADAYRKFPRASWRTMSFDGVRIGFAPDDLEGIAGKTSFPTFSISMLGPLGLDGGISANLQLPDWFPSMHFAGISVESLSNFAGVGNMFAFHFPECYLNLGFFGDNEIGKVFARFLDISGLADINLGDLKLDLKLPDLGALGIEFPDLSKIGGLVAPNFSLSGLSAALGTFGGKFPSVGFPDLLGGAFGGGKLSFDPKEWFSGFPKILGGIDLSDILGKFGFGGGDGIDAPDLDLEMPKIPGLTTEIIYKDVFGAKIPIGVMVKYRWCTDKFQDWGPASTGTIFRAALNADPSAPKTTFCMQVTLVVKYSNTDVSALTSLDPLNPDKYDKSVEAVADLNNFSINLVGTKFNFVVLQFAGINFTARTGSDPKVTPNLQKVDFDGALKYLMKLKDYFVPEGGLFGKKNGGESSPLAGFKFTPIFKLDKNYVKLGVDVGIPTLAVGVFSLSNLEVGVAFTLPFNSDPFVAYFHVCRADKPFLLTVGIFGGGGFFEMELGMKGVRMMRVGLEFGAAAQLNLGVASGSISVMGGISLEMVSDPDERLTLTGYVRLNGRLEILCIITLSLEFLLSLSYIDPPGTAKGRAKLTVTVEIAFFSKDVTMEVEKEFGGNSTGSAPIPAGSVTGAIAPASTTAVRYSDLMDFTSYTTYVDAFA